METADSCVVIARMTSMDEFSAGENTWTERLGNLRNTVRQELIGRHLEDHVQDGASVVDVGCGQGTQAIRLARRGCSVTGVDPSAHLLARCAADVDVAGVAVEMRQGHLEDLDAVVGDRTFEVVCAHGVLMYLDDPMLALDRLRGLQPHQLYRPIPTRNRRIQTTPTPCIAMSQETISPITNFGFFGLVKNVWAAG